jgi:hypothetical protein
MGRRIWDGLSARRAHLPWLLLLALLGLGLFGPHVLGRGTFIGDADRLNTFLNIRKFSADSIRELGQVPSWNDRMFLGFGTCGLHWMLPEADPFAYLEALLPAPYLFVVAGLVSCLFVVVAAWSCYLLAYDTCGDRFPSFVAAALYVLSSFAVNRICQVDWAYAVLICAPLGLLTLRRLAPHNAARCFLALTGLAAFMLLMTFLQEVAYVFALFGLFACYRAARTRSWRPLVVVSAAILTASVFAFPRLYTVFEEVQALDRSKSFQTTNWLEVLRWFDEGVFGRFPAEVRRIDNGVNLHEGVQFHSSIFAALLVIAGAVRLRRWREGLAGVALLVVLGWVLTYAGPFARLALYLLGYVALLGCLRAWALRSAEAGREDSDLTFHLLFLAFALAVILIVPIRMLVHKAFLSADFTHSRITAAALPSLSVLIALFLGELRGREVDARVAGARGKVMIAAAVAGAALLLLLKALAGPLCRLLRYDGVIKLPYSINALPREVVKSAEALVLFGLLVGAYAVCRRGGLGRRWVAGTLGWLMVGGGFYAAYFQIAGPHTWSFPEPFKDNNYFMAPGATLRPPALADKRLLQRRLESDQYRTAVVAYPKHFFAYVEPHLAEFWGLRLTGGYSAGVPKRLAALPWPDEVRSLRSLSFPSEVDVSWPLLALLNTKYVLVLEDGLYYNLAGGEAPLGRVLENPLPVLPRQFFAGSVRSVPSLQAVLDSVPAAKGAEAGDPGGGPAAPRVSVTVQSPCAVMVNWYYPWGKEVEFPLERRDGPGGPFRPVGTVPGSGRSCLNDGLQPGQEYAFRVRARRTQGDFKDSEVLVVRAATDGVPLPRQLAARRTAPGEALLTWEGLPDTAYLIEQAEGATRTFAVVGTTPAGASSYKVTGLGDGPYGFRVRSCRAGALSVHSEPVWVAANGVVEDDTCRTLRALFPDGPRRMSLAEGFPTGDGPVTDFDDRGDIRAAYEGDRVTIDVTASDKPRFLVLNELYHPRWRAFAGGQQLRIYPTNIYMRGVVVPPGVTRVRFEFTPFLHRPAALAIMAGSVLLMLLGCCLFRRLDGRAPAAGAPPAGE